MELCLNSHLQSRQRDSRRRRCGAWPGPSAAEMSSFTVNFMNTYILARQASFLALLLEQNGLCKENKTAEEILKMKQPCWDGFCSRFLRCYLLILPSLIIGGHPFESGPRWKWPIHHIITDNMIDDQNSKPYGIDIHSLRFTMTTISLVVLGTMSNSQDSVSVASSWGNSFWKQNIRMTWMELWSQLSGPIPNGGRVQLQENCWHMLTHTV